VYTFSALSSFVRENQLVGIRGSKLWAFAWSSKKLLRADSLSQSLWSGDSDPIVVKY
jgi:hypothetical protein